MRSAKKTKLKKSVIVCGILLLIIGALIALILYLRPGRLIDNFKQECIRQQKENNTKFVKVEREALDACKTINQKGGQ